jgi:hypothetical protein
MWQTFLGSDTVRLLAASEERIELAAGWTVPKWAESAIDSGSSTLPSTVTVRVEVIRRSGRTKASVTSITIGDGSTHVTASQLRELAKVLPELPARVLFFHAFWRLGTEPNASPDEFARALRAAARAPGRSQFEREDEVLTRWESEFAPMGVSQRHAAEELDLTYNTFRTYLAHARARRGK